jgi:hypothetical protein
LLIQIEIDVGHTFKTFRRHGQFFTVAHGLLRSAFLYKIIFRGLGCVEVNIDIVHAFIAVFTVANY